MGFLFSAPKMPALPPVAPAPEPPAAVAKDLPEEQKAEIKAEQDAIERKRKGRKSTILTGPLGDISDAEIQKKTLLGS
jgi:hypothetical protein